MPRSNYTHPQRSKQEIIDHCKNWLAVLQKSGISDLLDDYIAATEETDILIYPIATQNWVTQKTEPDLWNIIEISDIVDSNYGDRQAWAKLFYSVKKAIRIYESDMLAERTEAKKKSRLESRLVTHVLPRYDLPQGKTTWRSHDTIGLDDIAHYFSIDDQKYVLVWNDFPNATFIHEEGLKPVLVRGKSDEWLHIETGELAGYYSLYEDY